jgi:signal transduction histidine kinase
MKRLASAPCDLLVVQHMPPAVDARTIVEPLAENGGQPPTLVVGETGIESSLVDVLDAGADGFWFSALPRELLTATAIRLLQRGAQRSHIAAHLNQHNRNLELLNRAGQALTSIHDLKTIIDRLLAALVRIVDADGSSIWLWSDDDADEDGPWLVCEAVYHREKTPDLLKLRLRGGEGVAGWVVEHQKSTIVMAPERDRRFMANIDAQSGFSTNSLLAVPLRTPQKIVGVLEAVNKRQGVFDANDLVFAETLAAWAAIAIENARLVSELRQRTDDLRVRNRDLDMFGRTVAHDLKTPLALIAGYSELLNESWDSLTDEERQRSLRGVLNGANKMENIIEELITMAGLRDRDVSVTPLDMGAIVAEAQEHLAYLLDRRQGTLIVPEQWPVAVGHAPWVEQIWVNYITNALKYGGHPPSIELGAERLTGEMICFWVKDNGPGLTADEQRHLFEPFSQVADNGTGHGLGLSIVRQIVEKLGGEVGVESALGQGSRFMFTLPADVAQEHEARPVS